MTIGHRACRRCSSKNLMHHDLNMPGDSIDFHKRVAELASRSSARPHASQTTSLAVVGLVVTSIVGAVYWWGSLDESSRPKTTIAGLKSSIARAWY